jgi:hypothetical protein
MSRSLAALALALAFICGLANAQTAHGMEWLGAAGDWSVGCDWNESARATSCAISTTVVAGGYSAAIVYYPYEHRLLLVDPQVEIDVVARIDSKAPQLGQCRNKRCQFDDRDFADGLEKGNTLTLLLSGDIKGPAAVDKNLHDLRQAVVIAKKFAADSAKSTAVVPRPSGSALVPSVPPSAKSQKQIAKFGQWRSYCNPAIKDDEKKCHIEAENKLGDYTIFAIFFPVQGGMGFEVVNSKNMAASGADITLAARLGSGTVKATCDDKGFCIFVDDSFFAALLGDSYIELLLTDSNRSMASWIINAHDIRQSAIVTLDWLKRSIGKN